MPTPKLSENDNLAHIDYSAKIDADDPKLLRNRVSSTNGSIVIVSGFGCSLVLTWSFDADGVAITLTLQTPVGDVTLINTELNASNPSITVGGSVNSFKAEATVSFNIDALVLTASGEVCAPFVGCKSGSISVNV